MPTPSPFSKPEEVAPLIKALVYGPSGIGKTRLALTFPGPIAFIDTEAGSVHYVKRPGLSDYERLMTKSYVEAKRAVDWLASGGHPFKTAVIDPVSVLYEVLQDSAIKRRSEAKGTGILDTDLLMPDWGRIKRQWKTLMTALVNLPMHVVCVARQSDVLEKNGDEMVKVGVKFDAEKKTDYWFDVVLQMGKARDGEPSDDGVIRAVIVEKDRTPAALPLGSVITNPTFERLFGEYVKTGKGTASRVMADDEAVAAADAQAEAAGEGKATPAQVGALEEALRAAGQDPAAILAQQQKRHPEWTSWAEVPAASLTRLTTAAQEAARKLAAAKPAPDAPATSPEPAGTPSPAAHGEAADASTVASPPDAPVTQPAAAGEVESALGSAAPSPDEPPDDDVPVPTEGELVGAGA